MAATLAIFFEDMLTGFGNVAICGEGLIAPDSSARRLPNGARQRQDRHTHQRRMGNQYQVIAEELRVSIDA